MSNQVDLNDGILEFDSSQLSSAQEAFESLRQQYAHILSVSDAEQRLIEWRANGKQDDLPAFIIYSLLFDKDLAGTADEYHNLVSEFARKSLYTHSVKAAQCGAKKYSYNVNLLADIIKYASQSNDKESCQKAYDRLKSISRKKWTWRAFTFVIDYLMDEINSVAASQDNNTEKELLSIISEFKKTNDERAWVAEAEFHLSQGRRDRAIKSLKDGISKVTVTPQCCIKLADLLLEAGEYKDVVYYAAIGLRGTAQEQPSASIGYLAYVSALAKDALIHQEEIKKNFPEDFVNKENTNDIGFSNKQAVHEALSEYQLARELLNNPLYLDTISQRTTILQIKADLFSC